MEIQQPKHGFYQPSSVNDNGSIASDSPSEFSEKDAVNPNLRELMEQSFKDKYEIMKRAYEERISQLSYVIQETCHSLLSDEVIAKMKTDPTSQGYIPSHLSELLNNHVHGERERYVHDLVQRCAAMESTNRQHSDRIQVQDRKIRHLESDVSKGRKAEVALDALFNKFGELEVKYEELTSTSSASIQRMETQVADLEDDKETLTTNNENLNNVVMERGMEIEGLKQANEAHIKEIRVLQEGAENSARDLAVIEDLDKEEQAIKAAMKEQLEGLTAQNQSLTDETHDLRQKMKYHEEDIDRLEEALKGSDNAVQEGKQKMQGLMKQVEGMLAQEAQESNAAIAIVHEKMMNLRHKLTTEIAKEKRFSAAQAEELESLRTFKEEKGRELRILQEDEALLREKLNREQQRVQELHLQVQESHAETVGSKKAAEEAEFRARQSLDMMKIVEERLVENEKKFGEELSLAEQRVRVESARDLNDTASNLDVKSQSIRLHYQNELGAMQNQLRHSYGGKPSAFPGLAGLAGIIPPPPPTPGPGYGINVSGIMPAAANNAPSIVHVPTGAGGAGASGVEALVGTLQAEAILKEAKEHWNKEKSLMESAAANHLVKIEALEAELATTKRTSAMSRDNLDEALETKEKHYQVKLQEVTHKADMQLRSAKDSLAEAMKVNDALKKTLAEKRHLVEDLQSQLEGAQTAISDHSRELTHHRTEHHTHKKSAQDLLQNHTTFVREAKSAHAGLVEELDLTRKAHAELLAEHEDTRNQLAMVKSRHDSIEEERQRHQEDKHKLGETLEEWRHKHHHEKSQKEQRILELESSLSNEKDLHSSTKESLTSSLEAMKMKHDALHKEAHSLREEHRRLQEQIQHEEFSHMSNIELLLALREYYHDLEGYAQVLEEKLDVAEISYEVAEKTRPHIHHHHANEISLSKAVENALSSRGLDVEFHPHKAKNHPHHHHHHSRHRPHAEAGEGEAKVAGSSAAALTLSVDGRTPEQLTEHLSKAVERCHTLEGQVRTLTDELESTKSQALQDHEQDSKMISDMKTQFDALMKIHDQQQVQQVQQALVPERKGGAEKVEEAATAGGGGEDGDEIEEEMEVFIDEHGKKHHHRHHHHHRHRDHHGHHHHHHSDSSAAGASASASAGGAEEPVMMLTQQSQAEVDEQMQQLQKQVQALSESLKDKEEALCAKEEELSKAKMELGAIPSPAVVVMPESTAPAVAPVAAPAPASAPESEPHHHHHHHRHGHSHHEVTDEQQQLALELRKAQTELETTKQALVQAQLMQEESQVPLRINGGPPGMALGDVSQGALVVTDLSDTGAGVEERVEPVSITRGSDGVLVVGAGADASSPSPGQRLARVAAFESVTRGMIDALVTGGVITAAHAAELMEEAETTEQGNVLLSSKAQNLVSNALMPFLSSHKDALKSAAKIESLKKELETMKRLLSDSVEGGVDKKAAAATAAATAATKHGHSRHHARHTAHAQSLDESVSIDGHSEASHGGISKAAKELLAGELEQSKQENALLLELTKLEGDARVKTLISKLKATKKAASATLEILRQEKTEVVQVMEAKHKAEIDLLKEENDGLRTTISAQADSLAEQSSVRSSTLDSKLQLERAKRKDLIKEFEKVDQEHRITIEELENLNLQLEQRCERAELQVTKLRMDAIGKDSDLVGAFESGPHMTTEDNIIMRMFSPPGKGAANKKAAGRTPGSSSRATGQQ